MLKQNINLLEKSSITDNYVEPNSNNSDIFANKIDNSIKAISGELETYFKNISGYRTEVGKEFTFRVWTEAEFNSIVKNNGYKLFE